MMSPPLRITNWGMCTGEPRCQEEMLKRVPKVAERSDLSVVETDLVPRINQLCLATTNAGVRVAALSGLAALAARLPKDHALRSLSTIHKVHQILKGCCTPTEIQGCLVRVSNQNRQRRSDIAGCGAFITVLLLRTACGQAWSLVHCIGTATQTHTLWEYEQVRGRTGLPVRDAGLHSVRLLLCRVLKPREDAVPTAPPGVFCLQLKVAGVVSGLLMGAGDGCGPQPGDGVGVPGAGQRARAPVGRWAGGRKGAAGADAAAHLALPLPWPLRCRPPVRPPLRPPQGPPSAPRTMSGSQSVIQSHVSSHLRVNRWPTNQHRIRKCYSSYAAAQSKFRRQS